MVKPGLLPRAALAQVKARLKAAGCSDAGYDAGVLFTLATGQDARLAGDILGDAQAQKLEDLCQKREARTPLQYLAGQWDFLDFTLAVGPGVLCPRADSETVVLAAVEALRAAGHLAPRVLDLCAGTGALGLGARRFLPQAAVTCVEKSPQAMLYLQKNQASLVPFGIAAPAVCAVQGDLFTYWQSLPKGTWDAVVCNPPYLTAQEMQTLQPEVAQEPAMALDGGRDGLVFYRALAQYYSQVLRPGGLLALEIGWQQKVAVQQILHAAGWQAIRCRQDAAGNDRCILANWVKTNDKKNN